MNVSEIFKLNLRGHEYIAARELNPQIAKEQHQCASCLRAEMLPAVLNILKNWVTQCAAS